MNKYRKYKISSSVPTIHETKGKRSRRDDEYQIEAAIDFFHDQVAETTDSAMVEIYLKDIIGMLTEKLNSLNDPFRTLLEQDERDLHRMLSVFIEAKSHLDILKKDDSDMSAEE